MATLTPTPDLIPCMFEGLHDHLRLSHCEERVRATPVDLAVLCEGCRDYGSNRSFASIYCQKLPPAATFNTLLPAPGSLQGCDRGRDGGIGYGLHPTGVTSSGVLVIATGHVLGGLRADARG
jgi:hypothetical protein